MREKHRVQAEKYSAVFPASSVTEWTAMIKAWELDQTKPDPYAEPEYSEYIALPYIYVFRRR